MKFGKEMVKSIVMKYGSKVTNATRKHAPTILTIAACGGVILTAILAADAKQEANDILEEIDNCAETAEMSNVEKFKKVAPSYIPTVVSGIGTITCILSLNYIQEKRIRSILTAYELCKALNGDYSKKIEALLEKVKPEEVENLNIKDTKLQEVGNKIVAKNSKPAKKHTGDDDIPYMDVLTGQLFYSNEEKIKANVVSLNYNLLNNDLVELNQLLDLFGCKYCDVGQMLGWDLSQADRIDYSIGKVDEDQTGMIFRPVFFNANTISGLESGKYNSMYTRY